MIALHYFTIKDSFLSSMTNIHSFTNSDHNASNDSPSSRLNNVCKFCYLYMFVLSQGDSVALIQSMILMVEISNNLSKAALSRVPRTRPSWSHESSRFSDKMFLRLFRMYRQCFNCLCIRIEKAVGEKVFKSEKYLDKLRASGASSPFGRMNHASETSCGSWIPGEAKLAMTLR